MHKIEKNIPIPSSFESSGLGALMRSLDVGDSVVINEIEQSRAAQYARANKIKIKTKKIDGIIRMWRLA